MAKYILKESELKAIIEETIREELIKENALVDLLKWILKNGSKWAISPYLGAGDFSDWLGKMARMGNG